MQRNERKEGLSSLFFSIFQSVTGLVYKTSETLWCPLGKTVWKHAPLTPMLKQSLHLSAFTQRPHWVIQRSYQHFCRHPTVTHRVIVDVQSVWPAASPPQSCDDPSVNSGRIRFKMYLIYALTGCVSHWLRLHAENSVTWDINIITQLVITSFSLRSDRERLDKDVCNKQLAAACKHPPVFTVGQSVSHWGILRGYSWSPEEEFECFDLFLVHRVQENNRPQRKIAIILTNNIQASQKKNPSHTHTLYPSKKRVCVCVSASWYACLTGIWE